MWEEWGWKFSCTLREISRPSHPCVPLPVPACWHDSYSSTSRTQDCVMWYVLCVVIADSFVITTPRHFRYLISRSMGGGHSCFWLSRSIVSSKQYFYISERLFKEIANPLIKVVAIDVLKKTLKQEGILCPENTRTFTVKMGYYNLVTEYKRKRMLRFSRDKLDHVGELDFFGKE